MSLEAALLTAVGVLAAVVAFLFRALMNKTNLAAKFAQSQLKNLEEQFADAVARIRVLEDARVLDERQHGHELKALADQIIRENAENRAAHREISQENQCCMRELVRAVNRLMASNQRPDEQSEIATAAISRKDHA